MSQPFPGFVGPSYQLSNKYAAVERTVNFYLDVNEAPAEESKFRMALAPSPANAPFSRLPVPSPFNQPCRGLLELRGNVFGVNGTTLFFLEPGGGMRALSNNIADDGKPVSMVANGNGQIFVASAGRGYTTEGGLTGWVEVDPTHADFLGASYATFQDGYIIVLTPGPPTTMGSPAKANQFQISGNDLVPLGDAGVWSAANVSIQAGQQDNLVAIISSREYLRILGERRSQIYYNVGNNGIGGFPFQSYNETFIETGCGAAFSLADMGDSLIWIGQDARGQRACWRDAAFQPQRISTFAVEQTWAGYARVDDAISFPMIWNGHLQCQITFPAAGKTWLYDATASMMLGRQVWTERNYTNARGQQTARSEQFHCFAYGKHLVGSTGLDGNPGAVYQYSDATDYDCGVDINGAQALMPIVSDRICPHIWHNNKRIIHNRLELELAKGTGSDGGNPDPNPQMLLRWSNDDGNTYGPEYNLPVGQIGDFKRMTYLNRLGYARDRVYWLRAIGGARRGIVNAELDIMELAS